MKDAKARKSFKCRYQTAPKKTSDQPLPDGSHIKLSAATKVAVSYSETRRHIRLFNGEAQFSIYKDISWPLIIESRQTLIRTHKSIFNMDQRYGETEVTVLEGKIIASPIKQTKNRSKVEKGETLKTTENSTGAIKAFDIATYKDWCSGYTQANNIRLAELLIKLNRFTDIPLITRGRDTNRLLISGTYDLNHIENSIHLLSKSYNLKATREEFHIILEQLAE